jgi:hypothetical protein
MKCYHGEGDVHKERVLSSRRDRLGKEAVFRENVVHPPGALFEKSGYLLATAHKVFVSF